MESFFGVMKNEMSCGHEAECRTFEEFKKAVSEYVDYYNNRRIKSKTKWMPPAKCRAASALTREKSLEIIVSRIRGTHKKRCIHYVL